MSDIEDFLMSHIEPILRRTGKPVAEPETSPVEKPNLKENYEKDLKILEFYSNNLKKLNKDFEKEFKKFKPIPTECAQCQYYFIEQACKEARKNHDCPKYK